MAEQVRVRIWLAPTADFDSGWQAVSAGASQSFNPGLSNEDDCVVYLEFKNASGSVHHTGYGGNKYWNASDVLYLYGAYWDNLSPTSLRFTRQQNDTAVSQFRIRVWRNDPNPVPRFSWKNDWSSYEVVIPTVVTHGLGGNVDDYVLDMRFRTTGLIAKNHLFFGSIYGKYDKSGAFYQNLNSSSLEVYRELNDGIAAQIMLRIWNAGYTPKTVYVSGHISFAGNPLPDVAVTFSGTDGGTCYTDSSGNYSMSLPYNYSGTATPSRIGYTFTPTHQDFSSLVANATTNYTAGLAPSIAVTAPNGGEFWAIGSSRNITWTSTGASANVKIEYSTNSGSSYALVAASTANSGTYPWTIPNTASATCLVKVSDAASPSLFDVSDAPFAIVSIPEKRLSWTSGHSGNAAIAVDLTGQLHVVWQDNTPGNFEVYYKKSTDGGVSWTTNKRITFTSGNSGSPIIVVDASFNLHVVWEAGTAGNSEVYYKKSTDAGVTWTTAKRLSWTLDKSENPIIKAGSSNLLHLVWREEMAANAEIFHKKSTDGGATWSAAKRITWNSGYSVHPDLALDSSDNPGVVWQDDTPGNTEVYYKKSTDGGASWTTNKRLTWTPGFSTDPAMSVDSLGHLHLIFMDDSLGHFEVYYRKSLDGGMTWATMRRLTWSIYAQGSPDFGVDSSGNIHLVWECMAPGNYEIFYMKFK
jgi:hypothetical protein